MKEPERPQLLHFYLLLPKKKGGGEFPPSFESAYLQEMPNQKNSFMKYPKDAKSKCGKSDRKISHFLQQINKKRFTDINCEGGNWGCGYNSVAKNLLSMHKTQVSIPGTRKEEGGKSLFAGYGSKP